jgi:hypothetical protein
MGRQVVYIGYPKSEWLPAWLKKHDWGVDLLCVNSDISILLPLIKNLLPAIFVEQLLIIILPDSLKTN